MSLLEKIFKSREHILEMLKERNFNINNYKNYSINEINMMFNNHPKTNKEISPLDISIKSENTLLVKYILTPRIRISNIQTIVSGILEDFNENDTLILILKDKITSEETLEEYFEKIYNSKKIFIQYFHLDTLTFNITKHEFVPKHIILNTEEKTDLISRLNILSIKKFPKIKKIDPVAKYLGMKRDDICKILRPSETAGMYNYYRLCE